MAIRIILADDHPVILRGIRSILESEKHFEVLAEFRDSQALLHSPLIHKADLLLLDLNMPKTDGLEALATIMRSGTSLKTIIISAYNSPKLIEECRQAGACAYVLKTEHLSGLKEVITDVMQGKVIFPETIPASASGAENKFSYLDDFLTKYKLTKREVEIIRMICNGMTSVEIADKLFLSVFTIQTHRKNILRKLSLDHANQMSLFDFASRNGLL